MESFANVLPPSRIGRYEILERLGAGGMAEVLVALRVGLGGFAKPVAIKRILPLYAGSAEFRAMMHREASLAAMLDHPNCVDILELEDIDGQMLIAMELLFGCDASALAGDAPLEPALALRVISDAARGLHHAHTLEDENGGRLGVVHRDISPQNIFVTADGVAKVLDFGIASASEVLEGNTRTGALKGKYCFMAPEQVDFRPVDARTDVWALGVTLWGMLAGQSLYDGEPLEILDQIRDLPVPPLRAVGGSTVTGALEDAVMRALQKEPADRYPDAAAMADALDALGPASRQQVAERVEAVAGKRIQELRTSVKRAQKVAERLSRDAPASGSAGLGDSGAPALAPTQAGIRREPVTGATAPDATPANAKTDASEPPAFAPVTLEPQPRQTLDLGILAVEQEGAARRSASAARARSETPSPTHAGATRGASLGEDALWFVVGFAVVAGLLFALWPLG